MSSSKNAVIPSSKNSVLPHWMRQGLEHLSMKTNLEEYGTSPPENENLFFHEGKLLHFSSSRNRTLQKPDSVPPMKTSSLVSRVKEMAPRDTNARLAPQVSLMIGDQTRANTAPQSVSTTPPVTPQQSPTLIRKYLSADSYCKAGASLTDSARKALVVPVTRVTNFDLNAVSPTSW